MRVENETLSEAASHLEQALATDADRGAGAWGARLEEALDGLEQALGRQDDILEDEGAGLFGSAQEPSPGLDRRVHQLHEGLAGVHAEARVLRGRLRQMQERALPAGSTAGLDDLRRRAASLLGALRRYEHEDNRLVQENSTTDIGAGD